MRWQPITDRALRNRAARAVRELAAILGEPAAASPSLALGDAGTAVFFAYLARARFPVKHAADRARFHAGRAAEAIRETALPLGLFGGITGIAWMLQHLRGAELPRRDVCGDLDAALRSAVGGGALDGFDLVHGLCGIGVYALARGDRALARRVVEQLRTLGRPHGDGVAWIAPGSAAIDLGTAHGLAGLVAMLGQARGARIPGAATLSRRALAGLLGHARWDRPAVFPAFAAELGDAVSRDARLAWCYGDIGAACALQTAAESTGDAVLAATALRMARQAALRPAASSGVVDCGICHGAAGVALGLQRMFVAGGDPALRDAARRWLGVALDHGVPPGLRDGSEAAHGRGLLGGAGLGLAYLAATTAVGPRWASALAIVPATAGVRAAQRSQRR